MATKQTTSSTKTKPAAKSKAAKATESKQTATNTKAAVSPATAKKKREYSKIGCTIVSPPCFVVGVWMIHKYYALVELAINSGSSVVPDAALPIAGINCIFAPFISYLLYHFGLKNSRNKYGVDAEGQPYERKDS